MIEGGLVAERRTSSFDFIVATGTDFQSRLTWEDFRPLVSRITFTGDGSTRGGNRPPSADSGCLDGNGIASDCSTSGKPILVSGGRVYRRRIIRWWIVGDGFTRGGNRPWSVGVQFKWMTPPRAVCDLW